MLLINRGGWSPFAYNVIDGGSDAVGVVSITAAAAA
jgi:hypothetical protein